MDHSSVQSLSVRICAAEVSSEQKGMWEHYLFQYLKINIEVLSFENCVLTHGFWLGLTKSKLSSLN